MKICFFAPADSTHTIKWCSWFSAHGHKVQVISLTPGSIDGERKTSVNITIKIDKLNTGYEYQKCELDCALRKEGFASRCETLLLHD